jgi:hypothetical protein
MTVVVTHTTPADSTFSSTGAAAWNADHALSGVGTMAEQNKTSVDIEGGTIDSTVIGGTTPAAGTFTTLTANTTGTTTAKVWSNTNTSPIADLELQRGTNATWGGDAFTDYRIRASGGNFILQSQSNTTSVLDLLTIDETNNAIKFSPVGVEQMRVTRTASAVNYVQVTGAATGGTPVISAQGSDAGIALRLNAKGGSQVIFSGNGVNTAFQTNHVTNAVNYFQATPAATGFGPILSAQGSDTNIPAVVQPKGTGALQAQQTDSTATGGNARGANAVDWQTSRSTNSMVASGIASVLVGGQNNTSSSYASFLGGGANSYAQASNCFIGAGNANLINLAGQYAAIVAGNGNTAQGYANFIGGGFTNSGTSGSAVTSQSGTMNGTTAVTLSGSNASIKVGQLVSGTSIASETYVAAISGTSLTLSKVASGSSTSTLSFYTPHGVVVGGGNNQATGSYSFIGGGGDAGTAGNRNVASGDWSTVGGGFKNVATGQYSFIGGGFSNTASNQGSVVSGTSNTASAITSVVAGGTNNVASGQYSAVLGGYQGTTRSINGFFAFPANVNPLGFTNGVIQGGLLCLGRQTTDATPTVLTSDAIAASTTNQVILPNNSAYYFRGEVVAGVTGGGNTKGWFIEGVIKRGANAASTALVGTPTVTSSYADAGASTWTIAVTADTTNGGLAVTFTGQAGTTIRVVAQLRTTEMTF